MGRPPSEGVQLKIRVREHVLRDLERAAAENGWPVNREIASRLERSLAADEQLGDTRTAAVLRLVASMITAIEQASGKSWFEDAQTAAAVRRVVADVMKSHGPGERVGLPTMSRMSFEQDIARGNHKEAQRQLEAFFAAFDDEDRFSLERLDEEQRRTLEMLHAKVKHTEEELARVDKQMDEVEEGRAKWHDRVSELVDIARGTHSVKG